MRVFLLLLGLALAVPPAAACGIPWHRGQPVTVASEDALIVWDAAAKTEHFVRRANFRTQAKDFGFLVPTPTRPTIEEVDPAIFTTLSAATAPKIIYQHRTEKVYTNDFSHVNAKVAAPAPAAGAVAVLDRKKVAGYEVVVLKADDPKALRDWLDKNGYDARPELVDWFRWYTDHAWLMTAFKLSQDGSVATQLTGRTVRLTFQTDVPFYPYREPADMRKDAGAGDRLLRVYVLADKRVDGTLGKAGDWPGRAVWSNPSPVDTTQGVFAGLKLNPKEQTTATAKTWRLTEFEDASFPRPGTDEVYFRPAADQAALDKPPVVVPVVDYEFVNPPPPGLPAAVIGGMIVGVVGVIGLVGWRLLKK